MAGILIGVSIFIAAVFIAIMLVIIMTYNELVRLNNSVKNSFAQIDAQLQRRLDLIPNLVETVKGFVDYEKELLEDVTASRGVYLNAASNGEKLAVNSRLTANLRTLFAVAENYPELRGNTNFLNLQDELSEAEDKVTFARQFYNDAVTIYNNKLLMFPGNIIGNMFGFQEEELLCADEEAQETPKVQF